MYYTGHGYCEPPDPYYICTKDFREADRPTTGVPANELPLLLAARDSNGKYLSEQPPTLVILDCCYSGSAGLEILQDIVNTKYHRNLWIWATAASGQWAEAGKFAEAFAAVLRAPSVGHSMDYIPADTVAELVNNKLKTVVKLSSSTPRLDTQGPRAFFQTENLLRVSADYPSPHKTPIGYPRYRGTSTKRTVGGYLTGCTGRLQAAKDLSRWVKKATAGNLAVVTGSPGAGKSTLLALPVLLSQTASRETLLLGAESKSLAHAAASLFPQDTNVVAVHARGLNTDQVASQLARGLDLTATTAAALLEQLDERSTRPMPLLVVDALDEATSPVTLRDSLLLPLKRQHQLQVLIGARRHVLPPPSDTDLTIDLDDKAYHDPEAVVDYIRQLLIAAHEPDIETPYQDDYATSRVDLSAVSRAIAQLAISRDGVDSFLIAQVIALAVRSRTERIDRVRPVGAKTCPAAWVRHSKKT